MIYFPHFQSVKMNCGTQPSKRGDKNLRRLLVQCARVFILRIGHQSGRLADWVRSQLGRKHSCVVCCALANKLARIAWAITTRNTVFEQ
ncbi:transposase [Symbiopectobacterium sp. Eva_TO]